MNTIDTISSHCVPDGDRVSLTTQLFGMHFPMQLEPFVFDMAGRLSSDYTSGYWKFYALSNGGFYMAPQSDRNFHVASENGYQGQLSADALGITACLYAYSHLSFTDGEMAQTYAQQYHWLRDYLMMHAEVRAILGATD